MTLDTCAPLAQETSEGYMFHFLTSMEIDGRHLEVHVSFGNDLKAPRFDLVQGIFSVGKLLPRLWLSIAVLCVTAT